MTGTVAREIVRDAVRVLGLTLALTLVSLGLLFVVLWLGRP